MILFCGEVENEGGTIKRLLIDFEPFKPINITLYSCDHTFKVDELKDLLEHDAVYGFIVVDGNGALYATL